MPVSKKPLPLDEVRRRILDPKTKIVMGSQDAIEDLRSYVDRVLAVVKEVFGIGGAWVSDESCLSDFFDGDRDRAQDQLLYDRVGAKLGLVLDRANDEDNFLVKIALKLKRHESPPS